MEKIYQNRIGYFFILIFIVVIAGFFFTYIVKFPTFEGITNALHFHGLMFLLWIFMLIAQPFLIRYQKYALHRKIGKISYFLVPLLLFSIFLILKGAYYRELPRLPAKELYANLTVGLPDIFVFATFYILAIINKQNPEKHMRYMIGTGFMVLGPGLGRALIIFGGMPFEKGFALTGDILLTICFLFLLFDFIKKKSLVPFSIISLMTLVNMYVIYANRYGVVWQSFAKWFIEVFF